MTQDTNADKGSQPEVWHYEADYDGFGFFCCCTNGRHAYRHQIDDPDEAARRLALAALMPEVVAGLREDSLYRAVHGENGLPELERTEAYDALLALIQNRGES